MFHNCRLNALSQSWHGFHRADRRDLYMGQIRIRFGNQTGTGQICDSTWNRQEKRQCVVRFVSLSSWRSTIVFYPMHNNKNQDSIIFSLTTVYHLIVIYPKVYMNINLSRIYMRIYSLFVPVLVSVTKIVSEESFFLREEEEEGEWLEWVMTALEEQQQHPSCYSVDQSIVSPETIPCDNRV